MTVPLIFKIYHNFNDCVIHIYLGAPNYKLSFKLMHQIKTMGQPRASLIFLRPHTFYTERNLL